jgi:hypothetical protein
MPVEAELVLDMGSLFHLEALRDGVDDLIKQVGNANNPTEFMIGLREDQGWQQGERRGRTTSVRKIFMASSRKYFAFEVVDHDGRVKIKIRYAGGVE